nr:hypothetical protein Itr_chr11CG01880 [Ipomoea trifida]
MAENADCGPMVGNTYLHTAFSSPFTQNRKNRKLRRRRERIGSCEGGEKESKFAICKGGEKESEVAICEGGEKESEDQRRGEKF